MDPVNSLLTYFLKSNNKDVQAICMKGFETLFACKEIDYFLTSNYVHSILGSLLPLISQNKSPLFFESLQCLRALLLSPNQHLYIHDNELSYLG